MILTIVGVIALAAVAVFNINVSLSTNDEMDVVLDAVEVHAQNESSMHGQPLLRNSSGAYKCGNCTGSDCGAVC
ncbi:MAG: hypothetical protein LBL58_16740 [Tannerellaceae bacterium]|nr:hypothetical protein [Tannerellaceae bacterium]